jgi:hypothetical protein
MSQTQFLRQIQRRGSSFGDKDTVNLKKAAIGHFHAPHPLGITGNGRDRAQVYGNCFIRKAGGVRPAIGQEGNPAGERFQFAGFFEGIIAVANDHDLFAAIKEPSQVAQ